MINILHIFNFGTLFYIVYLFIKFMIQSIHNKTDLMGNPPINRFFFIIGKSANFTCWGIFIYKSAKALFIPYHPSIALLVTSSVALMLSAVLIYISFKHLGSLNKFGLSTEKTAIVDTGIYSISRNPMYAGFYLLNISSALFFPVPVNIFLCVTGIILHHFIVLGEEKFMDKTFGPDWAHYKEKVRRYL